MPETYEQDRDRAANPVLSEVTRSGRVESRHRGCVAVWHDGQPLLRLGDVDREVHARSAIKPLQALPLFERGVVDRFGLSAGERAVLCASHDGTDAHVAAVRSLLQRFGLHEEQLGCGPHAPFSREARLAMLRRGDEPQKVHNNCSGKHAGFLRLQQELGGDLAAYLDVDGPAQREVQQAVAGMAGLDAPLATGLDGCGAPTLLLPTDALARAFASFANLDGLPPVRAAACRSILAAVAEAPELLAGEGRLCTALLRALPCRAFPKNGAEGVYVLSLAPDPGRARAPGAVGVAIKIDDGNERGYQPVVLDLLLWLGAFGGGVPEGLQRFHRVPIRNTQRLPVGEVRCVVDWSRVGAEVAR